ncbi:hypothetical protein KSS87_001040 [Heliosperma pusillum]|nr:hypothetical protein KSS87_001040 [Heliosperma pusillum]
MSRNIETENSSARTGRLVDDDRNEEVVEEEEIEFRDIHAMITTVPPSRRSSNLSVESEISNSSENFSTMSREFNALVLAGADIVPQNLDRIGEDEEVNNELAIVADNNPLPDNNDNFTQNYTRAISNNNNSNNNNSGSGAGVAVGELGVHIVKKEEVDAKITAWQTAKIAKLNNRFKREDAIITGWENEQIDKASTRMKIVERKLEEKRAKAMEKMQNDVAKAHRKAEERRASAEGKRGIKAAKVLHNADLMRAVGRSPAKRSFF